MVSSALAAEPFVGRWAVKPEVCSRARRRHAATAALVATDTSLWWFDGYCRIGKMYKAKAVYVQAHCGDKDVPVTLDAQGDRMRVTWDAQGRGAEAVQVSRNAGRSSALSDTAAPAESVFGHRAFALYWFGRIVSILSFQMLVVAIGWQLYALTGSALDLGLLGLAQFVPMLVLTLLVGHVADRYDHRLILLLCQIVEALRRGDPGYAAPRRAGSDPLAIYVVVALVGAARAFEIPTMVAIIPALVPRALVPSATAWFASANQAGQIVGPVLGGLLYLLGPATVYGVAIGLWGVGGVMLAMMRVERAPRCDRAVQSALAAGRLPLRAARPRHPRHHRRSTCARCFSAARARCCRSSPATSCRPGRGASACCAPRRRSAR